MIILGNNNSKFYEYSSVNVQDLIGNFQDKKFLHDVKTPGDYGEYEQKSRVKGQGEVNYAHAAHNRNTSTNSVSLSVEDNDHSSDEEDDEEEEEEEEPKPAPKRRKVKNDTKQNSKRQESQDSNQPQNQQQQSQPQNLLPPPNISAIPIQHQQQHPIPIQYQQQPQQVVPASFNLPDNIPNHVQQQQPQQHQQQQHHHHHHPQHQQGFPAMPPQYQFPNQYQMQQQHGNSPYRAHESSSNSSTPIIGNSKPVGQNSPFTNNQRARSLNNNISTRPVLRVEIPQDHKNQTMNKGQTGLGIDTTAAGGDSAMTITAVETARNNGNKPEENNSGGNGGNTPTSGSSANNDGRPGLGILSNKSTPISATLPSGLFSLPPPQPNPQYQNQFGNGNNGAANFKPPFNINTGEQTPLTGGLPSRYVPDLFPSPSNFYSNEWNIPFGSGNTPYPNSAIQQGQMLPNINNGKVNKLSNLQTDGTIPSPLQNTPLGNHTKNRKNDDDKHLPGKRIKFEEP